MKTQLKQGFTMIEMLVVIVIIGILAGSMFPAVAGFMLNGNLTGMMGNGRKVVQAIIAADMSGRYESIAWPSAENAENAPTEKPNGPDMYQDFSSTAKYFEEALYVKEADVTKRNRLKVLKDIEPSAIAGQGVTTASGTTINDNNCAWALAKNTSNAPAKAPVFVTRNVNVTQLVGLAGNDVSSDVDTLLNSQKPFQKDGCVIIYKDGSGKKFTADEVFPKQMIGELGTGKLNEFEQGEGNKFEFLSSGKSN
jgi:prepilin-type N-terminal cleavage/methylation domain-containing protein